MVVVDHPKTTSSHAALSAGVLLQLGDGTRVGWRVQGRVRLPRDGGQFELFGEE
jgi:hypothetical protein